MKGRTSKFILFLLLMASAFVFSACGKTKFEVTFDVDGTETVVKVVENKTVKMPTDPKKDGYIFGGWFLDGEEFDPNTLITENITLKAKFLFEYTVVFDIEGSQTDVKVTEGMKVEKPEDPTKEGYVFVAWYLDGEPFNLDTPITRDMTLVAWFDIDVLADIKLAFIEYSNSLTGAAKIESGRENEMTTVELMYDFTANKEVNGLLNVLKQQNSETAVYVKEGKVYTRVGEEKTVNDLTNEDAAIIVDQYSFKNFINDITNLYDEHFSDALVKVSKDNTMGIFRIDLDKYQGDKINKSGKVSSFEVIITYDMGEVKKVEHRVQRDDGMYVINVSLNSLDKPTIPYPNLEDYK